MIPLVSKHVTRRSALQCFLMALFCIPASLTAPLSFSTPRTPEVRWAQTDYIVYVKISIPAPSGVVVELTAERLSIEARTWDKEYAFLGPLFAPIDAERSRHVVTSDGVRMALVKSGSPIPLLNWPRLLSTSSHASPHVLLDKETLPPTGAYAGGARGGGPGPVHIIAPAPGQTHNTSSVVVSFVVDHGVSIPQDARIVVEVRGPPADLKEADYQEEVVRRAVHDSYDDVVLYGMSPGRHVLSLGLTRDNETVEPSSLASFDVQPWDPRVVLHSPSPGAHFAACSVLVNFSVHAAVIPLDGSVLAYIDGEPKAELTKTGAQLLEGMDNGPHEIFLRLMDKHGWPTIAPNSSTASFELSCANDLRLFVLSPRPGEVVRPDASGALELHYRVGYNEHEAVDEVPPHYVRFELLDIQRDSRSRLLFDSSTPESILGMTDLHPNREYAAHVALLDRNRVPFPKAHTNFSFSTAAALMVAPDASFLPPPPPPPPPPSPKLLRSELEKIKERIAATESNLDASVVAAALAKAEAMAAAARPEPEPKVVAPSSQPQPPVRPGCIGVDCLLVPPLGSSGPEVIVAPHQTATLKSTRRLRPMLDTEHAEKPPAPPQRLRCKLEHALEGTKRLLTMEQGATVADLLARAREVFGGRGVNTIEDKDGFELVAEEELRHLANERGELMLMVR